MIKKRDYKKLFNKEEEKPLPTKEDLDEVLDILKTATKKEEEVSTQYGRPIKKKAIGRVKFTTMLNKDLRNKLKHISTDKEISLADLLEEIIRDYLEV
jgi:dTDP-4-dehydrorhamnose reductase